MGKCKNCVNWREWETFCIGGSDWGGCKILNNRDFICPVANDCLDVQDLIPDFYNNSHAEFGCIKFKKK